MCMALYSWGGTQVHTRCCKHSFVVAHVILNLLMCRNSVDALTVVSSIAYATSVAFQEDPSQKSYNQDLMCPHLLDCFYSKTIHPFP